MDDMEWTVSPAEVFSAGDLTANVEVSTTENSTNDLESTVPF